MQWPDFSSWLTPKKDWIQVEVTSFCNAACIYCPRTVYQHRWANRHLSLATFAKLLPSLARTRLVYLQGWGEPFLHPDFFRLVARAKQAGCRVGTTTNGMLLDSDVIRRLVESGIDLVAFSLAGTDEKNDAVRRGTSLKKVLAAIQALGRAKEELGSTTPAIHLAYMLLRSGLMDLEKLPVILQGVGVSQIVVSTLDFVPSKELEGEALRPADAGEYEDIRLRLQELARLGKKCGFNIHYQLQRPGSRRPTCTENVQQALVVSADGMVSPCVFTNLPVSGASYFKEGREYPYRQLFFGNVNERPLGDIWSRKAYESFRSSFNDGKLVPPCRECAKL
jgi:MoaA/NifB/PqqE/SkfB family radical SAM enzyme